MKRAVRGQPSSGPECIGAPAAPNVGVVPCESLAVAQSPWRASPGRHDDLLLDSVGQRQDALLASVGTAKHASTRQRGTATGRSPRERRDSEARFYSTAWDSERTALASSKRERRHDCSRRRSLHSKQWSRSQSLVRTVLCGAVGSDGSLMLYGARFERGF